MTIGTYISASGNKHTILREGKALRLGGDGITWLCTCGGHPRNPCGAMYNLWKGTLVKANWKMTVFGKKILAEKGRN